MKKTKLLSLLALSAVLAGCAEKLVEPDVKPEEKPGEEQVVEHQTITVSLPDDSEVESDDSEVESKVSIGAGEGKLVLNWEEDDQVTIIGATTETFKLSEGAGDKVAKFTGKQVEPAEDGTYTLIYPAVTSDEYDKISYEGQTQTGNNNISHIRFNAKAVSTTTCFAIDEVKMNGAIKFYMKLPAEIGNPTEIIVNSLTPIFYAKNAASAGMVDQMSLKLKDVVLGEDRILTAYMMTAPQTVTIAANAFLKITVIDKADPDKKYVKNIKPGKGTADVQMPSGKVNVFQINDQNWASYKLTGEGTEESPYQINDWKELEMMRASLVHGKKLYYKLMDNIDMTSIDNWVPLNTGDDLSREIDFNGNGKTIQNFKSYNRVYASFFGVLFGKCYDLTFENPVVKNDGMNSSCAVVGGYVGTGGYPATVERVNIKGGSVTCSTDTGTVPVGAIAGNVNGGSQIIDCYVEGIAVKSSAAMTGGIAGRLRTAADKIANCTFNGTITTSNSVVGGIVGEVENASVITGCKTAGEIVKAGEKSGGIVGNHAGNGLIEIEKTVSGIKVTGSNYCGGFVGMQANSSSQIKITNSISSGDINCTGYHIGGFVGEAKQNVTVQNCLTTGNITGNWTVGGICGRANNASWSVSDANLNIVVEQCLVWSPTIKVLLRDGSDGGGSGIVCGFTSPYNTLKSCFHSSALVFEGRWPGDTLKDPVDQDDADAGHPLSKGTSATGAGGTYVYPYWGKTYSGSASSKARELGWDETVWNLSGSIPSLK